jgi:hypothetical protein
VDVALCRGDNEQLVACVHAVDAFVAREGAEGILAREVPVFDRLVPGARCDEVFARRLEPADAFDARCVWLPAVRHLDLAPVACRFEIEVEDAALVAAGCDACAVLVESVRNFVRSVYKMRRNVSRQAVSPMESSYKGALARNVAY